MSTVSSSAVTAAATVAKKAWYDTSDAELSDEFWQYQSDVRESFYRLFSPLNISILLIAVTILYLRTRSSSSSTDGTPGSRPITFQTFTPRILLRYNGEKNPPLNPDGKVYIAVLGKVYDVTSGRNFYGPGGPYENFAGRDATRGLACQSFDEDMLTTNLDGPLDDCEDLDADQRENLRGWVERFDEKYLIVGKLMPFVNEGSKW